LSKHEVPGVYIEEVSAFPPPIVEVDSAVPAFVGYTSKATNAEPDDLRFKPTLVRSMRDVEEFFGDASVRGAVVHLTDTGGRPTVDRIDAPSAYYPIYFALQMFFDNGGRRCYVTSVGAYSTSSPLTPELAALTQGVGALALEEDVTLIVVPEAPWLSVTDYTKALRKKDLKKLRIGVPREYFSDGVDSEVEQAILQAVDVLKDLGGEVQEISLPTTPAAVATYYLIATAEASSNLARYDGVRYGLRAKQAKDLLELYMKTRQEGFGPEVKRRIMLGTYALSAGYYEAYYGKAQAVRTLIRRDFEAAFEHVDLIAAPVTPSPAFKLGEKLQDPLQMYLSDIYTISVNLAGIPAISIPCGFSKAGLPIGLQLLGRPFQEDVVLRGAHAYEQAAEWRLKKPPVR